ncbi:hypothetical protein TIFTF001_015095 [Ficus carica]|uniref:Reverse transcriptase zinc-binding domain-containing protein n=1 Tax=Ficus carica TaxID=3494 RepID=A0AA88A567_FICCA|nr:hypothetical protein TIFTF001_015095 [Ficus carica]
MDCEAILSIPLGRCENLDVLIWHFETRGQYTVRSGYWCALASKDKPSSANNLVGRSWWGRLWSLKLPSKVKLFLWRAFHGILPCYDSLGSRGIKCLRGCPRREGGVESVWHCLWDCHVAREQSRNAWVHSKRLRDARDTFDLAGRVLGDFHLCNQIDSVKIREPFAAKIVKWQHCGLKLNTDVSVYLGSGFVGVGTVIRDRLGVVAAALREMEAVEIDEVCLVHEVQNPLSISDDNPLVADIVNLQTEGIFNFCPVFISVVVMADLSL